MSMNPQTTLPQPGDPYTAFISDLLLSDCILQAGILQSVEVILDAENFRPYLAAHEEQDLYFLAGVDPERGMERARDEDVIRKGHFFIDCDVRTNEKGITDEGVKELGIWLEGALANHPYLNEWRYIVFSGNGLHIHYFGSPVALRSTERWREGMRCIVGEFEKHTKMVTDKGCINAARLCRLPGSYNNKDGRHVMAEILLTKPDTVMDIALVEKFGDEMTRQENSPKPKGKDKKWQAGLEGVGNGKRNETATSVAGRILHDLPEELWETAGWGGLKEWNTRNTPPLAEKELRSVFDSISKKARSDRTTKDGRQVIVLQDNAPAPTLPVLPDSAFAELRGTDIIGVLGSTVKKDDANKLLAFLAFLTVYTDDAQFNLTFQAPSASGKSYIALEVVQYFPKSDVMKLAYSSPQAFFHEQGEPVYYKTPEKGEAGKLPPPDATRVNLEGKIIIFVDQPHAQVLERLRPILSHDEKEINLQITDKQKGGGQRTKKIIVRGFPVVVFCTACLTFDEQEATRFLMLSPETTQGKLHEGILSTIERGSDGEAYRIALDADPKRRLLQQRVIAIKNAKIGNIIIRKPEQKLIESLFLAKGKMLKPRHQRDVPRFMNIMKAVALLNFMFREKVGRRIVANAADFEETKALWMQVNESQEYNLSPYFMQLYKELIVVTYSKANESKNTLDYEGITKKDILKAHHATYQRPLSDAKLRQEILPVLETAGLIEIEKDSEDRRIQRITPLLIDGEIVRRGGEEKPIQPSGLPF